MTNFKDITLIISDFKSGGTQKVVSQLIESLSFKKINLIVLGETKSLKNIKKISLIKLNLQKRTVGIFDALKNNIKILINIRNLLKKSDSRNVVSFIYETNILTILSSLGLNKRIIISERNNPYFQKRSIIWNTLRLLVYPLADKIVVNSYFAYDYFSKFVRLKKLIYIENPITIKKINIKKKKNIIVVSSLTKQKSIETIIKAFALFVKKNEDWRLLVVGQGPEEANLKLLAKNENLKGQIKWLGFKKNPEKIFCSSTIFCLPSNFEGMSNSLLEGLSYNLNCLVSDSVIHQKDPLKNFVTTFKRNDHKDLLNKLNKLKNYKFRNKSTFTKFAKENLNNRVIKKKWEDLFI